MDKFNTYKALLEKYYNGETSAEEEMMLRSAFESGVFTEEKLDDFYRGRWESADDAIDTNLQNKLYTAIKTATENTVKKRISFRSVIFKAAVCAACFLAGIFVTRHGIHQEQATDSSRLYSVITEKGQKTTVVLPDGTTVWLNSDSRLSYDISYGRSSRNVTLEGEGYFDVAKDSERPFTVHVDAYNVTALGTSFNISAYKEESRTVTTLVEGRVRVCTSGLDTQLTDSQSITFDKDSKTFTKESDVQSYNAGLWRNNELVVNPGTTLMQLAVILERNYNIQFEFLDESIKKYKFEGIIKNSQLTNVLELISLSAPVKYSICGNKVILDRNRL